MTKVWCVRAMYGNYTEQFVNEGYAAVGWSHLDSLESAQTRDDIATIYRQEHPDEAAGRMGGAVGQIARFLFDMAPGDIVVTPARDTALIRVGRLQAEPRYQYAPKDPACPLAHRRPVVWRDEPIERRKLSVPLQNTLGGLLTVFAVKNAHEILSLYGEAPPIEVRRSHDAARVVLDRVLELDASGFEELVRHLLAALGFEDAVVTGKTGEGGVDVKGVLNASGFARVRVSVQAKRYKDGTIAASTVKQLRSAIPHGEQGAFITTSRYAKNAYEVAAEPGFPPIGLIDGGQLVDLLVQNWARIPEEFRDQLGLKPGLVAA